jgi:hypothetical protein
MQTDSHERALTVLPFVGVQQRDKAGKIVKCLCPAGADYANQQRGQARFATVTIHREQATITTNCTNHMYSESDEGSTCKAQLSGRLCYHVRAALLITASEQKSSLEIHSLKEFAEKAVARHGRGWILTIRHGNGTSFAALLPKGEVKSEVKKEEVKPVATPVPTGDSCKCGAKLESFKEKDSGLCPKCDQSFSVQPTSLFSDIEPHGPYNVGPQPRRKKVKK